MNQLYLTFWLIFSGYNLLCLCPPHTAGSKWSTNQHTITFKLCWGGGAYSSLAIHDFLLIGVSISTARHCLHVISHLIPTTIYVR